MKTIARYKNTLETQKHLSSFLANLSTVYIQHHFYSKNVKQSPYNLVLAEELKIYDILGFSQVRLGEY